MMNEVLGMRVPKSECPDAEQIRLWAQENLPEHYRLISVRFEYGSDFLEANRKDFQIVIEYRDQLDPDGSGLGIEGIRTYHQWSRPLIDRIREQWPPRTLRIVMRKRVVPLK
jgi:hypothetical protein